MVLVGLASVIQILNGVFEHRGTDIAVSVHASVISVGISHGYCGACEPGEVAHQTFASDAGYGLFHILSAAGKIQSKFHDSQFGIDVGAEVISSVSGILQDAVLVHKLGGNHVSGSLIATTHREMMLVHDGSAEHLFGPVGVGKMVRVAAVLDYLQHVVSISLAGLAFVVHLGPLV